MIYKTTKYFIGSILAPVAFYFGILLIQNPPNFLNYTTIDLIMVILSVNAPFLAPVVMHQKLETEAKDKVNNTLKTDALTVFSFAFIVMHLVSWLGWGGSDWRNIIWANWLLLIPGGIFLCIIVFLKSKLLTTIFYVVLKKWSVLIAGGIVGIVL